MAHYKLDAGHTHLEGFTVGDFVHSYGRGQNETKDSNESDNESDNDDVNEGEHEAGFWAYKIKAFRQVDGEPGALLQWYSRVQGGSADEFAPMPPADDEIERLVCLGKTTVTETISEGTDDEYVVLDIKAIKDAITQDVTEEQKNDAEKQLRSMVGGGACALSNRPSKTKRTRPPSAGQSSQAQGEGKSASTGGSGRATKQARIGANKENEDPMKTLQSKRKRGGGNAGRAPGSLTLAEVAAVMNRSS